MTIDPYASKWAAARAIESKLTDRISLILMDYGFDEDQIAEYRENREFFDIDIHPVTEREIQWRMQQARKQLLDSGLSVKGLTD